MEVKFIVLADAVNQSRQGELNITGEFNPSCVPSGHAEPVLSTF